MIVWSYGDNSINADKLYSLTVCIGQAGFSVQRFFLPSSRCSIRNRARAVACCSRSAINSRGGKVVRYSATWMPDLSNSKSSICSDFLPVQRMMPSGEYIEMFYSCACVPRVRPADDRR